jgi:hypothetical protein
MDLIENTKKYYEVYSVFLPTHLLALDIKAMSKTYGTSFGCNLDVHSQLFLIAQMKLNFLISAILSLKFQELHTVASTIQISVSMWQFLLGISQENCMFPNPEKKSVKKLRK